jgi:cobalamin synthase
MTQPRQFRIWPRLGLRGWVTLIFALAVTLAILVAITAVALGIVLFLLPVLAVAALLFYLFPSMFRPAQSRRKDATIIDGEYRVVDSAEIERRQKDGA